MKKGNIEGYRLGIQQLKKEYPLIRQKSSQDI